MFKPNLNAMRSKFLIALIAFIFTGFTVSAQVYMEDQKNKDQNQDQVGMQQEKQRKEMIANVMNLSQEEEQEFWNVYDDYRQEIGQLQQKEIELMNNYAESYGHLSNEQADEMVKELLELEKEEATVKKDYRSKFEDVIPATKVARFYQADNKIDLAQKYEAARRIPIIEMEDDQQMQQRDQYQQEQQQQEYDQYNRQRQYEQQNQQQEQQNQQRQYEEDQENDIDYEDQ
jgi:hypothetical protein